MEKIYVNFKKPKTIKKFIELFFIKVPYHNALKSSTTYSDENCTIIQCNRYKYRSFDDFYKIIKTYYPSYTKKKLMIKLLKTNIIYKNITYKFFPVRCYDIDNMTFLYMAKNKSELKEWYKENISKCWSEHSNATKSWKELFELAGVYNAEDYGKYIH